MSSPSPADLNRRDFFSLSAILAGSVVVGDLLQTVSATGSNAEALTLEFDTGAWLTESAARMEAEGVSEFTSSFEPENPYTLFLDQADDIFRAGPKLRILTINNLQSRMFGLRLDVRRLAACPHLAQLHTLNLVGCFLEPEDIRILGNSPYLSGLRRLVIWLDDIGDDGARALAAVPVLASIRDLSLNANRIGPAGVQAIASSPRLNRLESLDLLDTPIRDEGARALAESPHLQSLTVLRLVGNEIGPAGAKALAASSRLARLKELGLAHQIVGTEGADLLRSRFGSVVWVEDDHADPIKEAEKTHWRTIAAQPDDDAPRLAYADWLAKRDAPRAEFIRLQVKNASSTEYDSNHHDTEALVNNLLAAHGDSWLNDSWLNSVTKIVPWMRGREPGEPFPDFMARMKQSQPAYRFQRGLVERVELSPRSFVQYAGDLFRAIPGIRSARIACQGDGKAWYRQLAACQNLVRLTDLELWGVDREMLEALARSPHLARLRTLRITDGTIDAEAMIVLLSLTRLPHLTTLTITGYPGDDFDRVVSSGVLNRLVHLQLSNTNLVPDTLESLFRNPLPSVKTLDFSGTYFGDDGVRVFAQSPHIVGLRSLDLTGAGLTGEGAESLVMSHHLAGLEVLKLWQNEIGAEGAAAIAASPHMAGLKLLMLAAAGIELEGATAVANSPHLAGLRSLDLGDNILGDAGVTAVASSSVLRRLNTLDFCGNNATAASIAALAQSQVLSGVTYLHLSNNPIEDDGLSALAVSPYLCDLRMLSICKAGVGFSGTASLGGSQNLPHLSVLMMHANAIGDDGATAFARSDRRKGIRVLGLAAAGIGDAGAHALADIDSMTDLVGLELRGNTISDEMVAALRGRFGSRVRTNGWSPSHVAPRL